MRLRNINLALLSTIMLVSCDFLDFDETDGRKSKKDVYEYFETTEAVLSSIYSYIPQDFGTIDGAMRECASDDAEFGSSGASVQIFNNGNWSSNQCIDTKWNLYAGIRLTNSFIEEIKHVDFSRFAYNPGYKQMMTKLKYFPYEARLLRAFYFFELSRRYGDIPMPLTVLSTSEANSIKKTSYLEVINFIVSECDAIAPNLPVTYLGLTEQTGRMTKGFALALKSKALLYAASKIHNPNNDIEKWKRSAKASLDLINTNIYELDPTDPANNIESKEVVITRMNNDDSYFELMNFPIRFIKGQRSTPSAATFPSQNLVDAFLTKNGYKITLTDKGWITEDKDFDCSTPYKNRDPRFTRTVLTDGSIFKGSTIETFVGGKDYFAVSEGGTPTGYFLKRYIQETTDFTPDNLVKTKHSWVIYRYAETLLTYAESMIEAFDDANYTDDIYTKSALWALNKVRHNAQMPLVQFTTKEEFIETLRNEWRVEFAFEDHRFWDIRRWGIGNKTQTLLYGVKIKKSNDGSKSYQKFLYENRTWNERMYLYPIPYEEIAINANLKPQNTGW